MATGWFANASDASSALAAGVQGGTAGKGATNSPTSWFTNPSVATPPLAGGHSIGKVGKGTGKALKGAAAIGGQAGSSSGSDFFGGIVGVGSLAPQLGQTVPYGTASIASQPGWFNNAFGGPTAQVAPLQNVAPGVLGPVAASLGQADYGSQTLGMSLSGHYPLHDAFGYNRHPSGVQLEALTHGAIVPYGPPRRGTWRQWVWNSCGAGSEAWKVRLDALEESCTRNCSKLCYKESERGRLNNESCHCFLECALQRVVVQQRQQQSLFGWILGHKKALFVEIAPTGREHEVKQSQAGQLLTPADSPNIDAMQEEVWVWGTTADQSSGRIQGRIQTAATVPQANAASTRAEAPFGFGGELMFNVMTNTELTIRVFGTQTTMNELALLGFARFRVDEDIMPQVGLHGSVRLPLVEDGRVRGSLWMSVTVRCQGPPPRILAQPTQKPVYADSVMTESVAFGEDEYGMQHSVRAPTSAHGRGPPSGSVAAMSQLQASSKSPEASLPSSASPKSGGPTLASKDDILEGPSEGALRSSIPTGANVMDGKPKGFSDVAGNIWSDKRESVPLPPAKTPGSGKGGKPSIKEISADLPSTDGDSIEPGDGLTSYAQRSPRSPRSPSSPKNQQMAQSDQLLRVRLSARKSDIAGSMGHTDAVTCVAVFPAGDKVITGSRDTTAIIWLSSSGKVLKLLRGHSAEVKTCAVFPDGQRLVTVSQDEALIWSTSGQVISQVPNVRMCKIFPSGNSIFAATSSEQGAIISPEGETIAILRGHAKRITSCAIFPAGDRILTGSLDDDAIVWSAAGSTLKLLRGHSGVITACAVAQSGERCLTVSADKIGIIWSTSGRGQEFGKKIADLRGHTAVISDCALLWGGKAALTVSEDTRGIIWSMRGEKIADLKGHSMGIRCCAVLASSRAVITASSDGSGIVWSMSSSGSLGKRVAELKGHGGTINACTVFNGDGGDMVVTASEDAEAIIWCVEHVLGGDTGNGAAAQTDKTRPSQQGVGSGRFE